MYTLHGSPRLTRTAPRVAVGVLSAGKPVSVALYGTTVVTLPEVSTLSKSPDTGLPKKTPLAASKASRAPEEVNVNATVDDAPTWSCELAGDAVVGGSEGLAGGGAPKANRCTLGSPTQMPYKSPPTKVTADIELLQLTGKTVTMVAVAQSSLETTAVALFAKGC